MCISMCDTSWINIGSATFKSWNYSIRWGLGSSCVVIVLSNRPQFVGTSSIMVENEKVASTTGNIRFKWASIGTQNLNSDVKHSPSQSKTVVKSGLGVAVQPWPHSISTSFSQGPSREWINPMNLIWSRHLSLIW